MHLYVLCSQCQSSFKIIIFGNQGSSPLCNLNQFVVSVFGPLGEKCQKELWQHGPRNLMKGIPCLHFYQETSSEQNVGAKLRQRAMQNRITRLFNRIQALLRLHAFLRAFKSTFFPKKGRHSSRHLGRVHQLHKMQHMPHSQVSAVLCHTRIVTSQSYLQS